MSTKKLAAVRGMNDLLPADAYLWEWFEARVTDWVRSYGYQPIRTPVLEHTELFVRGIGEVTDIVEKEMYSFEDRLTGEHLTMRPEFTAGTVRAAIEHNLTYEGPKRVWSMGPVFRHERPQRGRYRQFHQVNVEALGFPGPDIDAEHISMLARLWKILGIGPVRLEINCLGQLEERGRHRADLIAHLERHHDVLDDDARRRLHANPLRILDTKNPALADVVAAAPKITDYLGDASRAHFEGLQRLLAASGIGYTVNARLVRGLDYYNLTVFEWITDALGAQGTICAGGRYDYLIEQMGGKAAPAVGWALGVERVLELIKEQGKPVPVLVPDAYAVIPDASALPVVLRTLQALRAAGVRVQMHAGVSADGMGSMKSQFKKADGSGAKYALIFGAAELSEGRVAVKPLRGEKSEAEQVQTHQSLDDVHAWAQMLRA
jgi:histidyl-tRNA synthetase